MSDLSSVANASLNPWLECSVALTIRIMVVGATWCWLVPLPPGGSRFRSAVTVAAFAGLVGTVVSGLCAVLLGVLGVYDQRVFEYLCLGIVGGTGVAVGFFLQRARLVMVLKYCVPGIVGFALLVAGIMALPSRGEWVLGGWDPGVYLNEGVCLDRTGTFSPSDSFFYKDFTPEEQTLFTRKVRGNTERFPGVVMRSADETFDYEFFRLTPGTIAVLSRCGGLRAAARINLFVAALACLCFAAFLAESSTDVHALFALPVLLLSPVLLYHTHVPVSEMLQLLLLCGIGLALALQHRPRAMAGVIPLLLFGAVVNRFSFLPLGYVLLCVIAWIDIGREDRVSACCERLTQAAALAIGGAVNWIIAPVSLVGWGTWGILRQMMWAAGAFLCAVAALELLQLSQRGRTLVGRLSDFRPWMKWSVGVTLSCAALFICVAPAYTPGVMVALLGATDSDNATRMVPYIGAVPLIMAVAGGWVLLWDRKDATRFLKCVMVFFLVVTAGLLARKHIADLYPYATRRYLPYTIPLVATLCSFLFSALWRLKRFVIVARGVAVALLLLAVGASFRNVRDAWSLVNYEGASTVLAEAAEHLSDEDIIFADHFWWGTPLALVHGKQVLNGTDLCDPGRPKRARRALDVLARVSGERGRLVTCTDDGIDICGVDAPAVAEIWCSERVAFQEIIHRPRASGFDVREMRFTLRVYSFTVGSELPITTRGAPEQNVTEEMKERRALQPKKDLPFRAVER